MEIGKKKGGRKVPDRIEELNLILQQNPGICYTLEYSWFEARKYNIQMPSAIIIG